MLSSFKPQILQLKNIITLYRKSTDIFYKTINYVITYFCHDLGFPTVCTLDEEVSVGPIWDDLFYIDFDLAILGNTPE